jgi:hypothetical protein
MANEGYISMPPDLQAERERRQGRGGGGPDQAPVTFEVTDKTLDFLGYRALRDLLGSLGKSSYGRHDTREQATGVETTGAAKQYEFGDTMNLDVCQTLFNAMQREGVKLPLVEYGQGYVSMSPAVQILEAAVLDKRLRHGGHPILRWQVSNAAIEMDPAGNRKVSKKRAIGHVDGLVALLMAMGQASRTPPPRKSVYATRGVLTLNI